MKNRCRTIIKYIEKKIDETYKRKEFLKTGYFIYRLYEFTTLRVAKIRMNQLYGITVTSQRRKHNGKD